jgi:hypothetical protein
MTFQQQQLSEAMDIDLDCPLSQNQFTNTSQSQSANHVPGFPGRSFSCDPPMLQCTYSQGEPSLPSPQGPFSVGSCAPEWTSSYPSPATVTRASQPHVIQPLQDITSTETLAFNVHPDTAILYFGFSQKLASANPTSSSHAECTSTGDMTLDENHDFSQPVSADHVQMQPIDQSVHQPRTLPVSSSDHQPEVIPRPSSPDDTVKAKGEMATSPSDLGVTDVTNSRRQT